MTLHTVIPAQAGTHLSGSATVAGWVPACAGMTDLEGKPR